MIVRCRECDEVYDDAIRWTICPHERFISDEDVARKAEGARYLGRLVRFVSEGPEVEPRRVFAMGATGRLSLEGLPGEFPPDLLVVVD